MYIHIFDMDLAFLDIEWYSSYMWSIPKWTSVYQLLTSVEESACEGQFWHLKNIRWKDMDVSHTNHSIERNHHQFVVVFVFFRQNFWWSFLIESESDLLTIQMEVTPDPWKGHLKPPRNPTNGGFSMEKLHPTTIPINASPSCAACHSRILCTLQRWLLPVGGTKVHLGVF